MQGNLSDLSLSPLSDLKLNGCTHVSGCLSELSSEWLTAWSGLRVIGVADCDVTGELQELQGLGELVDVVLSNTGVSGELGDLSLMPKIESIDLQGCGGIAACSIQDISNNDALRRRMTTIGLPSTCAGAIKSFATFGKI